MIYEIEGLYFSYPSSPKPVLNGVSFSVSEGGTMCVLGRNGAGKSTLLSCMLGLIKPQRGKLLLNGKEMAKMREREIVSSIGFVPQMVVASFSYSVLDFVLMGCAAHIGLFSKPGKREREAAVASLRELGIESLAYRTYNELSGGERQKAAIARAIVANPQVVIFDEPTAHLDFGSQLRVLKIIRELTQKGYTVVMTTHNPDHALLLGDKSALLDNDGALTVGDTENVITPDNLSRVYDADVRLEYIERLGRLACVYPNL